MFLEKPRFQGPWGWFPLWRQPRSSTPRGPMNGEDPRGSARHLPFPGEETHWSVRDLGGSGWGRAVADASVSLRLTSSLRPPPGTGPHRAPRAQPTAPGVGPAEALGTRGPREPSQECRGLQDEEWAGLAWATWLGRPR